jgi:uncharacterized DUF497 family protein
MGCGSMLRLDTRLLKGSVVAVVNTDRGEFIRIISVRKATKNEYRTYFQTIAD